MWLLRGFLYLALYYMLAVIACIKGRFRRSWSSWLLLLMRFLYRIIPFTTASLCACPEAVEQHYNIWWLIVCRPIRYYETINYYYPARHKELHIGSKRMDWFGKLSTGDNPFQYPLYIPFLPKAAGCLFFHRIVPASLRIPITTSLFVTNFTWQRYNSFLDIY